MAKFYIDKLLTINVTLNDGKWEWTSWEVYKDREMTELIDSSIEDTENLSEWETPLIDDDGVYYDGSYTIYGRVKVKYNGKESGWTNAYPCLFMELENVEVSHIIYH